MKSQLHAKILTKIEGKKQVTKAEWLLYTWAIIIGILLLVIFSIYTAAYVVWDYYFLYQIAMQGEGGINLVDLTLFEILLISVFCGGAVYLIVRNQFDAPIVRYRLALVGAIFSVIAIISLGIAFIGSQGNVNVFGLRHTQKSLIQNGYRVERLQSFSQTVKDHGVYFGTVESIQPIGRSYINNVIIVEINGTNRQFSIGSNLLQNIKAGDTVAVKTQRTSGEVIRVIRVN
jgi:hypothetical protein